MFDIFKNIEFENQNDIVYIAGGGPWTTENGLLLFEAVIHIEPEKEEIKKIFLQNKNNLLNSFDVNSFIQKINKLYENRKIIFKVSKSSHNEFVLFCSYTEEDNNISITLNARKIDNLLINKNNDDLKNFLIEFSRLYGHEAIHREQFLRIRYEDKRKKIFDIKKQKSMNLMQKKNFWSKVRRYLSDSHELMAYAWQIVNNFRVKGLNDNSIKKILKTDSQVKFEYGG